MCWCGYLFGILWIYLWFFSFGEPSFGILITLLLRREKVDSCSKNKKETKKYHHQQMLVRMQGKRDPHTLLVGMQASATTLENNMEAS
jgi:hypothetical protein